MPRKGTRSASLLVAILLIAGPAFAHSEFSAVRPFWSGGLHFLVSPLAVATVVGLIAHLSTSRDESVLWAGCLAGLTALFAARFGALIPATVAATGAVAAGLAAASGWTPHRTVAVLIAALAGIGIGRATELDVPDWSAALGVAFAAAYLTLLGIASLWPLDSRPSLAAPLRIGRRILGAWVAAIGLLLGTLALKGIGAGP